MAFRFEQLEIWKEALNFARKVFLFADNFPQKYQFSLGDQLRRSSLSISSNIAEGSGSDSIKEELRYLSIALKSAYESLSKLYFCGELQLEEKSGLKEKNTILIKRIRAYKNSKIKQLNR